MNVEIVVLVYSRAEHSIKVIESLIQNRVSSFTVLFDKADNLLCEREQEAIINYINKNKSLTVRKIFHNRKMGLAKSVVNAVTTTLSKNDGILFLEDDCVVRPGGINYFRDGLRKLQGDKRIRSICGYTYPTNDINWGSNEELVLLKRFSSWGWATWADRWNGYTGNVRRMIAKCEAQGVLLEDSASDLARLCSKDEYLNGEKDIWSIPWVLEHFATETFSVFPRETFIDNIGLDGTGTHCANTDVFDNSKHRSLLVMRDWNSIDYYPENELTISQFMNDNSQEIY